MNSKRLWHFVLGLLVHPTRDITRVFLEQFPELAEVLLARTRGAEDVLNAYSACQRQD
jgi:hypothetical protein